MSVLAKRLSDSELLELLNKEYRNVDGFTYVPIQDNWRLSHYEGKDLYLRKVVNAFSDDLKPYFRLALAGFARTRSSRTVSNVASYISMWAKESPDIDILDKSQFYSRKHVLGKEREYQLSTIRSFLIFWYQSGIYGITEDFIKSIRKIKFKGNQKGGAVKSNDPDQGPFTPIELKAILDQAHNALSEDRIALRQYLYLLLLVQRGFRTIQISELRFSDFYTEGRTFVNMPRGKQRGCAFRGQFTKFEISNDLMLAVEKYHESVVNEIGLAHIAKDLPLFPNYSEFSKNPPKSEIEISETHHANYVQFNKDLKYIQAQLNIISERTGRTLILTGTRFRRTVGSDMAREGYGVAPIARALDHEDNQNAGVYIESTPEIAERLDKKLCEYLAPLAQAFAGHIIKDETEATRRNDSTSRIRTETGQDYLGNCGSKGFCNAYAPVACYTCNRFEPWLDAPHHEVLEDKLREREEIIAITGDLTIASQIDRTILAVQNVIDRCAEIKDAATEEYDE
ncbi:hypothetical protein E5672_16005 [Alteromonas portus]|uniref:Tyr recombinase domain-containing protein n=1 Tax=Alteromonas portus TaxID=2565549 RepID=A0A4U0Z809_9ALTE|nr:site-specific integrase [Alteromonas portus]TKB02001.1 hypothetical protein E5672_16005 [Alteromonas portus]